MMMDSENLPRIPAWYVVHTNPRQEDRVDSNLRAWNVKTFTPKLRTPTHNNFTGLLTYSTSHLFPRYIFAWLNARDLFHKIKFTHGVHSLVNFGNQPASIDDRIIELIRSRIGEDGFVRLGEEIQPGDRVVINGGALRNFTGVFERGLKSSGRVMILLDAVNYHAHIAVLECFVQRLGSP